MFVRKVLLISLGLGLFSVSAELKWKEKTVHRKVHPLQLKTTAVFPFKNIGSDPVKIDSVAPSCSCLTAKADKQIYQPGETGCVSVVFNLDNRVGPQHKGVTVVSGKKSETLYTDINIPEGFKFASKRMIWETGEEKAPKKCRLTNASSMPLRLTGASSSSPDIAVHLETVRDGFEYNLVTSPKSGLKNTRAVVKITAEYPPGLSESKSYKVYIIIK